jgi:thiol:disulfide interchange protein DsbC
MNDRGRSRARLRLTLGALSALGTSLALSLALALATSLAAHAAGSSDSEAEAARVLGALRAAHPGTAILHVEPTPVPGLFEVRLAGAVAYVLPGSTRHMLFGRLFDLETLSDLTAPKLANNDDDGGGAQDASESAIEQPSASATVLPHELPLADAITTVRGNGARHLVVFSDPGCPYCRHLEHELGGIDNVTVHTFLVPFLGEADPIAIWCSPGREQAWQRWMLDEDRNALAPNGECAHPIGRNRELAHRLQVRGTPTLIWANGRRTEGLLSREAIKARLEEVSREQRP